MTSTNTLSDAGRYYVGGVIAVGIGIVLHSLYRVSTEALRLRLARMDGDARTRLVSRIIDDCNAVAAASGGVFGLGAHSSAESKIIRELAASFGVKP